MATLIIDALSRIMARSDRDDGQALAEYSLILAFIAIACVAALGALGLALSGKLGSFAGTF